VTKSDRLTLSWGQEVAIRIADRQLRLAMLDSS